MVPRRPEGRRRRLRAPVDRLPRRALLPAVGRLQRQGRPRDERPSAAQHAVAVGSRLHRRVVDRHPDPLHPADARDDRRALPRAASCSSPSGTSATTPRSTGRLAIADVLGIYGREGVEAAAYWRNPPVGSPGWFAFTMHGNYDGKGGRFGGVAVPATTSDERAGRRVRRARQSRRAARDARQPVDPDAAIGVGLDIAGFTAAADAARYVYSPAAPRPHRRRHDVGRVAADAAGVVDHRARAGHPLMSRALATERQAAMRRASAPSERTFQDRRRHGPEEEHDPPPGVPGADVGGDVPVPDRRPAQAGRRGDGCVRLLRRLRRLLPARRRPRHERRC